MQIFLSWLQTGIPVDGFEKVAVNGVRWDGVYKYNVIYNFTHLILWMDFIGLIVYN